MSNGNSDDTVVLTDFLSRDAFDFDDFDLFLDNMKKLADQRT